MPAQPFELPQTRFAPARGARLAYQVFGDGPAVVAIPPTAQNIEMSWEQPAIRAMLERFASFCRYLHFDKRGTGCSDRRSRVADLDERVDDLRAVMDDAGMERAHLFGSSEGGPMTLLFAATYPDRVDSIVLFGSGASMYPPGLTEQDHVELRERFRRYAAKWGTPDSPVAEGFAPSLVEADPSFAAWHRRYERFAASQDSLEELLELGLAADVRELLPDLEVPALVIHRTDDAVIPVERAREVVDAMPNARLFEQEGRDHFGYAGDVDGWMTEFERFVTGTVSGASTSAAPAIRRQVRIETLGRFAVVVDGDEVPTNAWGSRRARQLCKRLVAARGWPVTRDELFDLLWPDEDDRQRLGARLSVQLSTVRRILRGGVIADRDSVRLDLAEVATDLERFHRAETDEEIVDAFTGDLLPEDRYEDWTDAARTEVRTRFRLAAQSLCERRRNEAPGEVVALTTRLLELDPYDDDAHRRRVEALLLLGSLGEAQEAHQLWQRTMDELGLEVPPFEDL